MKKKVQRETSPVSSDPQSPPQSSIPVLTDLAAFQKQWGAQWSTAIRSPMFQTAIVLLNLRKLKGITNLSDDEIAKNGNLLLADLRGHLKHEEDLMTLHSQAEEFGEGSGDFVYVSPEEQAKREMMLEQLLTKR